MTADRNLSYRGGAIVARPLVSFVGGPAHSFNFLSLCLALVAAVAAGSGCVTFKASQPMPRPKGPLKIVVSEEQPSSWTDMPNVVLHVPGSSLYLSGNMKEGPLVGEVISWHMPAITGAIVKETARRRSESAERDLKLIIFDLFTMTREMIKEKLKRKHGPADLVEGVQGSGGTLEVIPYVVLTFSTPERGRPYVILKARLLDAKKQEIWWTRYTTSIAEDRPLDDDEGWAAYEGYYLRRAVSRGLDIGLDVMLKDAAGALPRATGKMAKVKGQYAWLWFETESRGELLEERDDLIVFIVRAAADGGTAAGVQVFEKKSVQVTPVEK